MMITTRPLRKRTAAMLLLSATTALAATAATAQAGTYRVWTCKSAANSFSSSAGWAESGFNPSPGQWAAEDCAGGGAVRVHMSGGGWGGNTWKAWTWTAPANTSIAAAAVNYAISSNASGGDAAASPGWWLFKDDTAYDGSHVLATCHSGFGCNSSSGTASIGGPANAFGFAAGCLGDAGGHCAGGDRLSASIYNAAIDLTDITDPTLTSSGGTALESRTLAGSESLSWTASDQGGGIWQSEVKIGNTVVQPRATVDANGGRCVATGPANEFGWPVPCKLASGQSIALDTSKVPDGIHTLTATVWDAANNATNVVSRRVTIDNVPPPAIKAPPSASSAAGQNPNSPRIEGDARVGSLLTAFDGVWTDASAQLTRAWQVADSADGPWAAIPGAVAQTYRPSALQAGKHLRVAVTAVSTQGTTTVTSAPRMVDAASGGSLSLLTANNGSGGDPASGKLVPSKKRTKAKVGFKKTLRVAGKLVDDAGKPISGAEVDAFETVPGGARTKVGTITTDAKGRYSWTPATRSNRLVELAYSRQKGSDNYQSSQSLQVLVRAGIAIKLKRHHIGPRGTGILTGRVIVDGLPSGGVRVEIHSRSARGRDLVIGTAKTDGSGRFKWKRKFDASYGYVPLSVKVLADRDMPAIPSRSRQVRLLIG